MYETSKAVQRRLHDSNFISRYFRGNGIDIGAGNDPLGQYIELFPLMESCLSYDKADGDAETMKGIADEKYDFVHSSHCLEDLQNPLESLKNWFRILKPGGHMVVTVPDEDMYEQGVFPSTFNSDHKFTFTVSKQKSWSEHSLGVVGMLLCLGDVDIIKIERLTGTYRFGLDRMDQTRTPIGEAAIEFVIRKRPPQEFTFRGVVSVTKKRIALHRPGAIGDIIMTLSLVPLLKEKYPDHDVHYFCNPWIGHELAELMKAAGVDDVIDNGVLNREKMEEYEQVINLIGYPLNDGYPEKPMAKHLIEYFAAEMGVLIPEKDGAPVLPHLTLNPGPRPPDAPMLYATIHPQAGWSVYKNWEARKWEEVIAACPDIRFYQIGSATDTIINGAWPQYMGKPIAESINLMAHAAIHLGIDSWSNHATHIQWGDLGFTPAIILWGSTQWDAAGYRHNVNISLGLHCQPCFREDPKISRMPRGPCINPPDQTYDKPQHACMADIGVERVLEKLREIIP
jgi:ADP-heptose:LPS heptosyltransferase